MADCPPDYERLFRSILTDLGEDPDREGLQRTPARVLETWRFLTRGQREDLSDVADGGLFEEDSGGLVLLRRMEFVSLCEHHMLPFLGHVHVGYVPDGRVLGLSKIARVVDHFACRLQLQERMTREIADCLVDLLKPRGLGVVVKANHLCMTIRSQRKQDSDVVTSVWRGTFESDPRAREDFLRSLDLAS